MIRYDVAFLLYKAVMCDVLKGYSTKFEKLPSFCVHVARKNFLILRNVVEAFQSYHISNFIIKLIDSTAEPLCLSWLRQDGSPSSSRKVVQDFFCMHHGHGSRKGPTIYMCEAT